MSLSRWRVEDQGAAAIEFALIAPVLLVLFVGMVNLAFRYMETARLDQVTRETAQAAMFVQDPTALTRTLNAAIADLGNPISGSVYAGAVQLVCVCPGQAEIAGCSPAQALKCPATGLPWEIVLQISARMDYRPLLAGIGVAEPIQSVLRVQVR